MTQPPLIKSRRDVLRAMFLGAAAAGLAACGGGSSRSTSNTTPDNGDTPQPPQPPVPPATELPLSPGPLANIGDLFTSDVDDILIPEGFSIRRVARAGFSPSLNFTLWHSNPDGGAVFQSDDGGWVYVSNSESTPGGVGALRFDANGSITLADAISLISGVFGQGDMPAAPYPSCGESATLSFSCDSFAACP